MAVYIIHLQTGFKMEEHSNSARRILSIIEPFKRSACADTQQAYIAWAGVFFPHDFGPPSPKKIYEKLRKVEFEIDILAKQLSKRGVDGSRYTREFDQLKMALGPEFLVSQLRDVKALVSNNLPAILEFCSHIVESDDEILLAESDLKGLKESLERLRSSFGADMPDRLREMLLHHVEQIEAAIEDYRITGARALTQALVSIGPEVLHADLNHEEEEAFLPVKQLYASVVRTAAELGQKADVCVKLVGYADVVQRALSSLL